MKYKCICFQFLGSTAVEQPKGIEVVKEAIRRLQFTQQLRKSEPGAKTKKVEITISVDGVAIQVKTDTYIWPCRISQEFLK